MQMAMHVCGRMLWKVKVSDFWFGYVLVIPLNGHLGVFLFR